MSRKRSGKSFFVGLLGFILVFALAFFGIQFFTKTGIFRIPGVVNYDEGLNDEEIALLQSIFTEDVDLDKDVTISAEESASRPSLKSGQYLYQIYVPVTDYYDIATDTNDFETQTYEYISIDDLDYSNKLLSVDGEYFLDSFDGGATFRVISFESEKFEEEIKPLVDEKFAKSFPDEPSVLSFAQTGVTALSRGMNEKLYQVGDANYFAEGLADYLSGFDLTHTSNESSFTNLANSGNICSDPRFIDTLLAIGLDIVELTGNHNVDCGIQAANDTIDIYRENSIKIVGGGKNTDEAAQPLLIDEKGNNITFLAYNLSTGGATHGDMPGANQYYEENAATEINNAKERGDFIIVDIQYYECSAYVSEHEDNTCDFADSAAGDQVGFFRHLIDLGADMVVGTSAHQPQTFELYGDGVIYYGLGNLFFDQAWWPGTTRSLVLENYFYQDKLLQTRITPTIYDQNLQTKLLDEDTAKWFIGRLVDERP